MHGRAITLELRLLVLIVLAAAGLASAGYVLYHERAPVPFRDTYKVKVELSGADGIAPGIGQPVVVAGVRVGSIVGARVVDGNALVTLSIRADELPEIRRNARAVLEPVTPLKDMQIALDPGTTSAPALPHGGTIPIARTATPVPLSDLLSVMDTDTRAAMSSMLSALGEGTKDKGPNMRRFLRALGPTTAQAGQITRELSLRRRELARLVHNLEGVTRAASRDERLADVVVAGNATLESIAAQDTELRSAMAKLPGTLRVTRSALTNLDPFARKLGPTLTSLLPAVRRLPQTLDVLEPFADKATTTLRRDVRPFVRATNPVALDVQRTVRELTPAAPNLTSALQSLRYFTNELGYNAPGDDEGGLFWLSWFGHNFQSLYSTRDAHGAIGRAIVLVNCQQITFLGPIDDFLRAAMGAGGLCPGTN